MKARTSRFRGWIYLAALILVVVDWWIAKPPMWAMIKTMAGLYIALWILRFLWRWVRGWVLYAMWRDRFAEPRTKADKETDMAAVDETLRTLREHRPKL